MSDFDRSLKVAKENIERAIRKTKENLKKTGSSLDELKQNKLKQQKHQTVLDRLGFIFDVFIRNFGDNPEHMYELQVFLEKALRKTKEGK
jgi:hypothetical protein